MGTDFDDMQFDLCPSDPKSAFADEAKPLAALVRPKRRGVQRIGDLLVPLLIRLGVSGAELGIGGEKMLQSNASEARSPAD